MLCVAIDGWYQCTLENEKQDKLNEQNEEEKRERTKQGRSARRNTSRMPGRTSD